MFTSDRTGERIWLIVLVRCIKYTYSVYSFNWINSIRKHSHVFTLNFQFKLNYDTRTHTSQRAQ